MVRVDGLVVGLALLLSGCASLSAGSESAAATAPAPAVAATDPAAGEVARHRGPGARLREATPESADGDFKDDGGEHLTWWPDDGLLYDPYLAAQRQARTAVKFQIPAGKGKHIKIENTLGLTHAIARWTDESRPDEGTEVEIEAAVFGRFDLGEDWDEDSTDWRFGFPVVHRDGDLAWKVHLYHLTSHLGDEYIQRTGKKREPYHLEEAAFGVSWDADEGTRFYGEAGIAIYASRVTKSGRFQVGWEWVGARGSNGLAPFAAIDLQARNEQNWNPGKTAAVGVTYGRHVRFGVEFYQGRDTQTQFLSKQVRFVSIGISIDI